MFFLDAYLGGLGHTADTFGSHPPITITLLT